MRASGATRRPMSAEETDKLLMQPWPGRAGHPLSACQPSAALFTQYRQGGAGGENRRIEGGRGMVNDNNAVGDQTVTQPSLAHRQYWAEGKSSWTNFVSSIQVEKKHWLVAFTINEIMSSFLLSWFLWHPTLVSPAQHWGERERGGERQLLTINGSCDPLSTPRTGGTPRRDNQR